MWLGQEKYKDWVEHAKDNILDVPQNLVDMFLEESARENPQADGLPCCVKIFEALGFTPEIAAFLWATYPHTEVAYQVSALDWAKDWVDYTESGPSYSFERAVFQGQKMRQGQFNLSGGYKDIPTIVLESSVVALDTRISNFLENIKKEGQTLFYHGTAWVHTENIIGQGIRMRRKDRQDFSDGCGFYLNQNLEDCMDWCSKLLLPRGLPTAILIYSLPTETLENAVLSNS